jgi:hypothetical protein
MTQVENRPRSPDAERMRRYRERLRRGVAYVPLPVTRLIVEYLVRRGLLPRDREAADRVEIGLAAAAALERAARADRFFVPLLRVCAIMSLVTMKACRRLENVRWQCSSAGIASMQSSGCRRRSPRIRLMLGGA